MSYFTMDLTGENPAYKVPNNKKRIVVDEQVLEFYTPVYLDTLELVIEDTVNSPMIPDVDWIVTKDDYDYEATGRAQLEDKNFDRKLIKSVHVIKPFVVPYTVNAAYQQLFPNVISYILQNPTEDVEITPQVLWQMLQDVENLKLATAPIEDVHAAAERKPILLPPDPDKIYKTNVIDGEVWEVDTSANKKIIFPVAGAFFRDSLKIVRGRVDSVDEADGQPDRFLKENEDYIVVGPDAYGIHHTSNDSGVFHLILFKIPYVGDVTLQYHAYGGTPTQYDVRALYESLTNVYHWVTSADVLTSGTVGQTALMREFRARLNAVEATVRKLALQGQPSYGDCTNGNCIKKKISSPDTEFHWWTIAELYQVAGSNTVFTAEIGHFQIQSLYTKLLLDFTVAVDINKPEGQQLRINTLACNVPQGFIPFVDDTGILNVLRPQLRIIYNKNSIQGSGVWLQLGMRLRGTAEETLAIADLSGMESCFKLIPAPDQSILPEDDALTLPNDNHYWSTDNPDSYAETGLIPTKDAGYVVWAGAEALNRPSTGLKTIGLEHLLEPEVDLSKLKTVKLWLAETVSERESNRFVIELPLCGTNESIQAIGSFTYASKAASLYYRAVRNQITKEVTMTLAAEIVAGINSNRLDFRYVTVNS